MINIDLDKVPQTNLSSFNLISTSTNLQRLRMVAPWRNLDPQISHDKSPAQQTGQRSQNRAAASSIRRRYLVDRRRQPMSHVVLPTQQITLKHFIVCHQAARSDLISPRQNKQLAVPGAPALLVARHHTPPLCHFKAKNERAPRTLSRGVWGAGPLQKKQAGSSASCCVLSNCGVSSSSRQSR